MFRVAAFWMMCLLTCRSLPVRSQYYFYNNQYYDAQFTVDLGLSAGGMNCLTDLGGRSEKGRGSIRDINLNATHGAGGVFAAFNYNNTIGLRLELTLGSLSGSDSLLGKFVSPGNGRYRRNLSFRTDLREMTLMVEGYPLALFSGLEVAMRPYVLAGIGTFSFNPQASWKGSQIDLSALHTEGEGFPEYKDRPPYKHTQLNIPFGAGVRYELGPCASIRCEIVARHLFTDYLDDVSTSYIPPALFYQHLPPALAGLAQTLADRGDQRNLTSSIRGNPSRNDFYFSMNLKLSVVLGRKRI